MNVFTLWSDKPNYYEKWIKKVDTRTEKSQLRGFKVMQMRLEVRCLFTKRLTDNRMRVFIK
jgi:hypothetical protein